MLKPAPEDDQVTFEDFCRLVHDGQKADLIDGVIVMASPDTKDANRLNGFVYWLMEAYNEARELGGEVYFSRFAFRLDPLHAPEPDVAYVTRERLPLVERLAMDGAPDIAVEIVSRSSRRMDYNEKREMYEAAGTREYWIIDAREQRAQFLRLVDGHYELAPLDQNRIFRSEVIPGFWLDVEWLFMSPLPAKMRCLELILAGAP